MLTLSFAAAALLAPQQVTVIDSTYATPAVRAIVERAALGNAVPPGALSTYSARVESEIVVTLTDVEKRETIRQIEQLASNVFWRRDGALAQELIGYRAQMSGLTYSALSYFRVPFLVPTLFGNRVDFLRLRELRRNDSGAVRWPRALHPLAASRGEVYRFTGGDTTIVQLPGRVVTTVRVHVRPAHEPHEPTLVFDGDIDIDVDRNQIVRMEGRLLRSPHRLAVLDAFLSTVLYVRLENAEYDEQFWLPREQRFEIQAALYAGEQRAVIRGVSRFVSMAPNDSVALAHVADPDSFPSGRMAHTRSADVSKYDEWVHPIGGLSKDLTAYDFEGYAPRVIRPSEGSYLAFSVRDASHVVRHNPVEGVFTGGGILYHLNSNNTLRLHAGYAWSEQAVRGGAEFVHHVGRFDLRGRAERVLAVSDDFSSSFSRSSAGIPLLISSNHRFLDRRIASAGARITTRGRLTLRLDAGHASDRNVRRHFGAAEPGDTLFQDGATAGDYWFARTELEQNAAASASSLLPGFSWRVGYEAAHGSFQWQRVDGGVAARLNPGSWRFASSVGGNITLGANPPPQAQFGADPSNAVPGYTNDNFVGRRTASAHVRVGYALPLLRSPMKIGRLFVPAIAPTPSIGLHTGWADVVQRDSALVNAGWNGVTHTSIDVGIGFFGGSVLVGVARPLGRRGAWRYY
jgi:hypothetical protein